MTARLMALAVCLMLAALVPAAAFERMCGMAILGVPEEDTLLLFETGESIQLRLEVTYAPTEETHGFLRTDWDDFVEGDFFAHVRASEEYAALTDVQPVSIGARREET